MSTVQIEGINYQVLKRTTPEQAIEEGHPNIAAMMRERGQAAHCYGKRPKGRRMYFFVEYIPRPGYRGYSEPVTIGNW